MSINQQQQAKLQDIALIWRVAKQDDFARRSSAGTDLKLFPSFTLLAGSSYKSSFSLGVGTVIAIALTNAEVLV